LSAAGGPRAFLANQSEWRASEAYEDVSNVVDFLQHAGIAHTIARMRSLAVIKG
jgi:RNA-splicing ligase RtcB